MQINDKGAAAPIESFCSWLQTQFETFNIKNEFSEDKWAKWLEFDQQQSIFERIGADATEFIRTDYALFLKKIGELGGKALQARQNPDQTSILFKSADGKGLGMLSKTNFGLRLEFSARSIIQQYGVDIEEIQNFLKKKKLEGFAVSDGDWTSIKELNNESCEIAKHVVALWVNEKMEQDIDGYTEEHFQLLQRYGGTFNNRHNVPEQQEAYDTLAEAYAVTEKLAHLLQKKHFPDGNVSIRKSPVNQGKNFEEYNWAKIYPDKNSPKEVAITVGISSSGYALKIDTTPNASAVKKQFEDIRGDYEHSAMVNLLSVEQTLNKSFGELISWNLACLPQLHDQYNDLIEKLGFSSEHQSVESDGIGKIKKMAMNQILYGPPGTGKTYHTIEAAIKVVEPNFQWETRSQLKTEYERLVGEERIRFVTFHQSYGYEDFVIGLTAKMQGEQISYYEKAGVFKEVCDAAKKNLIKSNQSTTELDNEFKFNQALDNFKLSMFDESDTFALTEAVSITAIEDSGFRYGGENWKGSQIMKYEDLRLLYENDVSTRQGIKHADFVSGLAKQHASYFIRALEAIKTNIPENITTQTSVNKQNYCLIIDEINRGNISKIFGELITLIEPSKRFGNKESLEVVLPLTGELFSVPNNLYLIGTMNTADRSLAMMDTALRRRFDFKEMMPNPKLFEGKTVSGIDLQQLLTTMNERIEILYDREHTLGHAFLMPVLEALDGTEEVAGDEQQAFIELQNAFKNKIIPLLEEYFYEDWNKISLVLGDSLKKDDKFKFIQQTEHLYSDLFGSQHGLDLYENKQLSYAVKPFGIGSVWDTPQAYIEIYSLTKTPNSES